MTAAGRPSTLYPTRGQAPPQPGSPEYTAASAAERRRKSLIRSARSSLTRLVRALDQVEELDEDGYLVVGVERLITHHEHASQAVFELTGELAELVAREADRAELVDEPDEPSDPAACTCGHPECGAC